MADDISNEIPPNPLDNIPSIYFDPPSPGFSLPTSPPVTTPPTLGAGTSSSPSLYDLQAGNVVTFTIPTSELVIVTEGGGAPTLQLNDNEVATYSGPTGTAVASLTFNYTVKAGDHTTDLQAAAFNALPSGTTIQDGSGNNADLSTFMPIDTGIAMDVPVPMITFDSATPATGDYTVGQQITFTLATNGPMTVTGTPTLTLNDGGTASYVAGQSNRTSLVFTTTVAAGQNATNLAVTAVNLPNGATIQDSTGTNAVLTGADATFQGLTVDTTPAITSYGTPSPYGQELQTGESLTFTIDTNEPVNAAGSYLTLSDGATATYSAASTSTSLVYTDIVVAADAQTSDLQATALNGTIRDAAGNKLDDTTFQAIDTKDSVPPQSPTITAPLRGTATTNPEPTFSGVGTSGDTIQLTLTGTQPNEEPLATVIYSGIPVEQNGIWTFTPSSPLPGGDYVATATQVSGGEQSSPAGDDLTTFTIDAPLPTIASESSSSPPLLTPGQTATFTIGTSEAVTATGSYLTLSNGATATYSGSSTPTSSLVYSYTMGLTDTNTSDLQATQLNGAITDAAGNKLVDSTFKPIDTQDAVYTPLTILGPVNGTDTNNPEPRIGGTGAIGDIIQLTLTGPQMNGEVEIVDLPVEPDGTWAYAVPSPLPNGTYTATAFQSNPDIGGTPSTPVSDMFTIDAPPTIASESGAVAVATVLTPGQSETFVIGTSEAVTATGSYLTLSNGAKATYTGSSNPTSSLVYTYIVGSGDTNTSDLQATQLNGTITDGVGNPLVDATFTAIDTRDAVDTPQLTITAPVNGTDTNNPEPTISGTGVYGDLVRLTLTGPQMNGESPVSTPVTIRVKSDGSWTYTPSLANGTYTATATQSSPDIGSTPSASVSDTFTVDVPPTITSYGTPSPNGATLIAGQTLTFTIDANEALNAAGSYLTLSNGDTAAYSVGLGTTLVYNYTVTTAQTSDLQATALNGAITDAIGNTLDDTTFTPIDTNDSVLPGAPTISVPADTTDPEPTFSGTGVSGDTVQLALYGPADATYGGIKVGSNGTWTFTPSSPLPDGIYSVLATQSISGNPSDEAPPSTATFTIDTPPSVTIGNAGGFTNQQSETISGKVDTTADPAAAGTLVTVYDNGTSVGTTGVNSDGSWSTPITLSSGYNTITASDTDDAGNTGTSKPVTYTQVVATPSVTIAGGDALTNQAARTISGTVDPASDPYTAGTNVTIYDNGKIAGTATVAFDGSWSSPITLSNGQNTITASDTDQAGNTGFSGSVTDWLNAQLIPVITPSGSGLTNQPSQTISGLIETPINVTPDPYTAGTNVTIYDNGAVAGTAAVSANDTWSSPITLTSGQNTITASYTDKAGNTIVSPSENDILDTATPRVTIANAGALTNQANQAISGTVDTLADPYAAGTTVTVYDNTIAVGTAMVGANGIWTTTSPITLSSGQNTITASDTDEAGNIGASSIPVTYTLDKTPPTVSASTLTVAENAGATAINIKPPSDSVAYTIIAGAQPTDGIVTLSTGQAVAQGETLTTAQLEGLAFTPTQDAYGESAAFAYTVTDLAGNRSIGAATLAIGAPNAPSITGLANATTTLQAPTQPFASATVSDPTGSASDSVTIALSGAAGTLSGTGLTANADGTYTLGFAKPAIVTQELDALIFTPSLANGGSMETTDFALTVASSTGAAATASVTSTVDSAPSAPLFGSTTPTSPSSVGGEVYALYQTILGRAPDAIGFETQVAAVNAGASLQSVAQSLLTSAEYANDYGATVASNAGFINQLYEDGLHRPADAGGQQAFGSQLAGGTSRAQVAVEVATSPESQNDLAPSLANGVFVPDASDAAVARLYYGLLGRAPDAAGLQSDEMAVDSGTSIGQVIQGMLGSQEYQGTSVGQDNLNYIEGLYQTALGRQGDAAGLQAYETGLDSGSLSRANVADAFLTGTEFQSDEADQSNASYVNAVFEAALGRAADPNGSAYWQNELTIGVSRSQMAEDIVGSSEFAGKVTAAGQAEFVQALYEGALGRAPAAGETQAWQTQISNGTSLASVAASIIESPEAANHLAPQIEMGHHIS